MADVRATAGHVTKRLTKYTLAESKVHIHDYIGFTSGNMGKLDLVQSQSRAENKAKFSFEGLAVSPVFRFLSTAICFALISETDFICLCSFSLNTQANVMSKMDAVLFALDVFQARDHDWLAVLDQFCEIAAEQGFRVVLVLTKVDKLDRELEEVSRGAKMCVDISNVLPVPGKDVGQSSIAGAAQRGGGQHGHSAQHDRAGQVVSGLQPQRGH